MSINTPIKTLLCRKLNSEGIYIPYLTRKLELDRINERIVSFLEFNNYQLNRFKKSNNGTLINRFSHLETIHYLDDIAITYRYIDAHNLDEENEYEGDEEENGLSENEAVNFLAQLLETLEEYHKYGLTHLDIKPTNILRDRANNRLLLDNFTFLKEAYVSSLNLNPIEQIKCIGTPGYIPPELVEDESISLSFLMIRMNDSSTIEYDDKNSKVEIAHKLRQQWDIYSLGVMTIQMMSGLKTINISSEHFKPLSLIDSWLTNCLSPPLCSKNLATILSKMIHSDSQKRYTEVVTIRKDLDKIVKVKNREKKLQWLDLRRKGKGFWVACILGSLGLISTTSFLSNQSAAKISQSRNIITRFSECAENVTSDASKGDISVKDAFLASNIIQDCGNFLEEINKDIIPPFPYVRLNFLSSIIKSNRLEETRCDEDISLCIDTTLFSARFEKSKMKKKINVDGIEINALYPLVKMSELSFLVSKLPIKVDQPAGQRRFLEDSKRLLGKVEEISSSFPKALFLKGAMSDYGSQNRLGKLNHGHTMAVNEYLSIAEKDSSIAEEDNDYAIDGNDFIPLTVLSYIFTYDNGSEFAQASDLYQLLLATYRIQQETHFIIKEVTSSPHGKEATTSSDETIPEISEEAIIQYNYASAAGLFREYSTSRNLYNNALRILIDNHLQDVINIDQNNSEKYLIYEDENFTNQIKLLKENNDYELYTNLISDIYFNVGISLLLEEATPTNRPAALKSGLDKSLGIIRISDEVQPKEYKQIILRNLEDCKGQSESGCFPDIGTNLIGKINFDLSSETLGSDEYEDAPFYEYKAVPIFDYRPVLKCYENLLVREVYRKLCQ